MSKENHLPHSILLIHCLILNALNYTCDLESDLRCYVVYVKPLVNFVCLCKTVANNLNLFLKLFFEDYDALGVLMVS